MKVRFTIGKKIGTGFGILILLTLIVFVMTYITLQESREINDRISTVNQPSIKALQELKTSSLETKLYLLSWLKQRKAHEDKQKLLEFQEEHYHDAKAELNRLAEKWPQSQRDSLVKLFENIDLLFEAQHDDVIKTLDSFESYEDPMSLFLAENSLEIGGTIHYYYEEVLNKVNIIIEMQKEASQLANESMFSQFERLKFLVRNLGIALIIMGVVIALYTTRTIVAPVQRLKAVAVKLGRGVFPSERLKEGNDEIGEMTASMNNVIDGLKRTKDFANEVGSGNFDTDYKPLSRKDTLGKALLTMRDDLAENERYLEEKVRLRTAEVVAQKEEIDLQKAQIEQYFVQVTDSIKYAKKIQEAILPPESYVKKLLPESFILYRPKDIVSGDFYWLGEASGKVFFAAVDCTGHGVPGAFMSIVGYNQLRQAIILTKGTSPADILNQLNKGVTETLHQNEDNSQSKDGMDIAICSLNYNTLELEYAGAFNPLYLLRENKILQTKANKFPIGSYLKGKTYSFSNHKMQLQKGDQVYIFSDGYADQFGGPRGKKFMYKRFRDLLVKTSTEPILNQKEELKLELDNWKKDEEQVDDILVIGVRV
jgi:serine phosphatase RsbU (regulator of sigma subunit)/HAMP domain-containing protein